MNVIDKPIRNKVFMVMAAPVIAGTGLGVTITQLSEYQSPSEFEFWDTLDTPSANPWSRLTQIQKTNEQIRLLSSGSYFGGGTGSGELPQFTVAEAQSNRISKTEQIRPIGSAQTILVTDVAAAVDDIRSTLSLSITDLSAILDVKRPTIYSWLRGDAQPHAKNLERITSLHQISQRWHNLSGRAMRRHLRHAFDDQGVTLLDLLKADNLDLVEIDKHLVALSNLPASKLVSMKEISAAHGLSTDPNPDAELIRDIESGKRFEND